MTTHSQLNFFEILEVFLYNDRKGALLSQNMNTIHIHYLKWFFRAFIEKRYMLRI